MLNALKKVAKFIGWTMAIVFAVVYVIGVIGLTVEKVQSVMQDRRMVKALASFSGLASNEEKRAMLDNLLRENSKNSHCAFYYLLDKSSDDNLGLFAASMTENGTAELLIDTTDYVLWLCKPFKEEIRALQKKGADVTAEEAATMQARLDKEVENIQRKMSCMKEPTTIVSRRNFEKLVQVLKKSFKENGPFEHTNEVRGAVLGVLSLGEEGFEGLLRFVKTDDDKLFVFYFTPFFGGDAVIPVIKQYENPSSSAIQRDTARLCISKFRDTEDVWDKVVEAYKHGRYFESNIGKKDADGKAVLDAENLFEIAMTSPNFLIWKKYEDNESFVDYVAENYLYEGDKQDEIISLLSNVNFKFSEKYFRELDANGLPEKSLDMLIQSLYFPSYEIDKRRAYFEERFDLFLSVFEELNSQKREEKKVVFNINNFPREYQRVFIISNFWICTKKEKQHIIFMCADFPMAERNAIYDFIYPSCDSELKGYINYCRKDGGGIKKF